MKTVKQTINIGGKAINADVDVFVNSDKALLRKIYDAWITLCNASATIKSRSINIPDGLTEGAFCLFMDCWRTCHPIPGAKHSSFDAYNPQTKRTIQVKSCSVSPDLTSFGPGSVWDELYLLDFSRRDTTFDVYSIPTHLINATKVNKNQTFQAMQAQGKRPRFSIFKNIIIPNKIKPIGTFSL